MRHCRAALLDALDAPGETGARLLDVYTPMVEPAASMQNDRFSSFAQFYPFYLSEHRTPACRRLHFAGTTLVISLFAATVITMKWWLLALIPLVGYGFAWIGHFAFERNRPATFAHPWYSLMGDFVMFRDILIGRIRF